MNGMDETRVTPWSDDRLLHGECARWIDGRLHLVDLQAGRLLASARDGTNRLVEVLHIDAPLGAFAARRDHADSWVLAAGVGIALVDADRNISWLGRSEQEDAATVRMNDGAVDAHGRFWAGSMSRDGAPGRGSLYRLEPDRTVVRVVDGLTVANGPAFSPDGASMYLTDSARRIVDRVAIDPDTGAMGPRRRFLTLDPDGGQPDGMTVDLEGALWMAVWGAGEVRRYLPDGILDRTLRVPASQPTSVCLGGRDGRDLFITSASDGLDDPGPADGALFSLRVDVPGQPALSAIVP